MEAFDNDHFGEQFLGSDKTVRDWLRERFSEAESVKIAVGFFSLDGLAEVLSVVPDGVPVRLLAQMETETGNRTVSEFIHEKNRDLDLQDSHQSVYDALEDSVKVRVRRDAHPKVYLADGHFAAGSANLTRTGLMRNLEFTVAAPYSEAEESDFEGWFNAVWEDDRTFPFEHVLAALCQFAPFGRHIIDFPVTDPDVLRRTYGIELPHTRTTLASQSLGKQLATLDEILTHRVNQDDGGTETDETSREDSPSTPLERYYDDLLSRAAERHPGVDSDLFAAIRERGPDDASELWRALQQSDLDWRPTVDPVGELWLLDFVADFDSEARDLLDRLPDAADRPALMVALRESQKIALANWIEEGREGIVEMATATGKTIVGLAAIADLCGHVLGYGPPRTEHAEILIIVHRRPLIEQWYNELVSKLGLSATAESLDPESREIEFGSGRIEIQTPQYFDRHPETVTDREYDLVIYDEIHHYSRPTGWGALLSEVQSQASLGLSAMLKGVNRELLTRQLGDIAYSYGLRAAQADGVLPDCEFVIHPIGLTDEENTEYAKRRQTIQRNLQQIRTTTATYETIETLQEREAPRRYGYRTYDGYSDADWRRDDVGFDLADLWRWHSMASYEPGVTVPEPWQETMGMYFQRREPIYSSRDAKQKTIRLARAYAEEGLKIIVFSMRIETANEIADAVSCAEAVHSDQSQTTSLNRIDAFRSRDSGVLVAAQLLDEGVDVPDADIGINVAATKTRLQLVQRLGRLLRQDGRTRPVFHHFATPFELQRYRELAPVPTHVEEDVEPVVKPRVPERVGPVRVKEPLENLSTAEARELLAATDPVDELSQRSDDRWWLSMIAEEMPDPFAAELQENSQVGSGERAHSEDG